MSTLKITDLWIYPIKSIAGIQLDQSKVETRGLQYDRRWVLADENGMFVHQRDYPEMALLQPEINGDIMTIRHKTKPIEAVSFNMSEPDSTPVSVTVWDDTCPAKPVDAKVDAWFSEIIDKKVRLLYMHDDSVRQADQRYAIEETDKVSFADGYPVLIISEESLAFLNSKSTEHVPMNRFRANVIVSGGEVHEEDRLRKITVGDVEMYGVKPCVRCVMTTIDVDTAQKGKEPLKTLSTYRKTGNKILFGENFIPSNEGVIRVGDTLNVLEKKSGPFD
ncbi:MOSC domain-containing protein [Roseivirga sp. E12]|uniref:MOSC domain-containing protein n=1 Tax=Roseivirga sp. E12 TaxID=2819237 RepID=UPI001ABC17E9|nr:MOSC N-terminal beta barrel domain-containing protein [Roseivirga sp. E12]MBO3699006.1 MOSC domain-containing protein [Roseivirga sp. E12]